MIRKYGLTVAGWIMSSISEKWQICSVFERACADQTMYMQSSFSFRYCAYSMP